MIPLLFTDAGKKLMIGGVAIAGLVIAATMISSGSDSKPSQKPTLNGTSKRSTGKKTGTIKI